MADVTERPLRGRANWKNVARFRADAEAVVGRLLRTNDTAWQVSREYRVSVGAVLTEYRARTTLAQRVAARTRKQAAMSADLGIAQRSRAPIGTVRVRTHQQTGHPYRWIKVRHDGPPQDRWALFGRWSWERANGPVPAGCRVVHADGDQMNDDLTNLACVSGPEWYRWHRARTAASEPTRIIKAAAARRRQAGWKREAKALREELDAATCAVTECAGCGFEAPGRPTGGRCPKCGGSAWSAYRVPLAVTEAA
jgi:hypothetical protein